MLENAQQSYQKKDSTDKSEAENVGKEAIQLQDKRPISGAQSAIKKYGETIQKKANGTGLPNQLKSGIENLSGYSMDDVKVHYNSSKPAQLSAHAYAQGTDIHVTAGQEKHLAHEAWHVVQQKQGRVKPIKQLKSKVNVNDDPVLEKEADVMGAKAMQLKAESALPNSVQGDKNVLVQSHQPLSSQMTVHQYKLNGEVVLQRVLRVDNDPMKSFQELGNYVSLSEVKDKIQYNTGQFIDEEELDKSVRSVDLSLTSGRDRVQLNENLVVQHLTDEILANKRGEIEANETLKEHEIPSQIRTVLQKTIGSREIQRLSGLIWLMWSSGQISVDKIIHILQEPQITHGHLEQFQDILVSLHENPLGMKMLGKLSVEEIIGLFTNDTAVTDFMDRVKGIKESAEENDLNPMHVVEIENDSRPSFEGIGAKSLDDDLKLIVKDVDNNLKEDLEYIATLEARFNRLVPDPDNPFSDYSRMKKEINRMKKMYAYKINYVTIVKQWPIRLKQEKKKLETDIKLLKSKSAKDIAGWKADHASLTKFRPRATKGYREKFIRKAAREKPELDKKIEERQKKLKADIKKAQKKFEKDKKEFEKNIAAYLNIDKKYLPLIEKGITLLPADMRLAGVFPKEKSLTVKPGDEARTHTLLRHHADDLLMDHGLYQGNAGTKKKPKLGMLPNSRIGCICIMYIKEAPTAKGTTYRPFFGASGIDPYEENSPKTQKEKEESSYENMGLPKPSETTLGHAYTAGSLQEYVGSMKRLGIKPPSMQSQLYFLQTPEYRSNKIKEDVTDVPESLISQAQKNTIGMLENWMPSNCAEPAIMTAIYQMYSKPEDIFLSVPFEGVLHEGKLLLKYTCTRCAVSEPAFMSPDKGEHHEHRTDMRVGADSPFSSQKLQDPSLIYNHAPLREEEDERPHPYTAKSKDIALTMWRNQRLGFAHYKEGQEDSAQRIIQMMHTIEMVMAQMIHNAQQSSVD